MFIYLRVFLFYSVVIVLFTACTSSKRKPFPKVVNGRYDLQLCKRELLAGRDYNVNYSIDKIVVEKKEHKMYLYNNNKLKKVLPISLGKNPVGPKIKRGDRKTPEGKFWITHKRCNPKYYRSLGISYPRPSDRALARKRGVDPGGLITIHAQLPWNTTGYGDKYTLAHDWTEGCIAVTNSTMQELWYSVKKGTTIIIR